jgi:hypothetical protein
MIFIKVLYFSIASLFNAYGNNLLLFETFNEENFAIYILLIMEARGSVVRSGIMLQAERSPVRVPDDAT